MIDGFCQPSNSTKYKFQTETEKVEKTLFLFNHKNNLYIFTHRHLKDLFFADFYNVHFFNLKKWRSHQPAKPVSLPQND